eukprot:TRINITY_DN9722_c0_g1_i1.p1 TRINITY_DN9722_c0_g1~~TRINITY_DN9722_c0_g1_i1.p1  ORF type:complete len:181 (+),score=17.14 TRINITY_DN9722_c0_g1_i1:518-1060(+)
MKALVKNYIAQNNLTDASNSGNVILDRALSVAFLGQHYFNRSYSKRDLNNKISSQLRPYYYVSRNGKGGIKAGSVKPIMIKVERRQGKKTITLVEGLENFFIEPQEFAADLKHQCAASCTITENRRGKKYSYALYYCVQVQGTWDKQVQSTLSKDYQVPSKYISIQPLKPRKPPAKRKKR